MFHDKDSTFLEEFKLYYEKEKQRCHTLESMVQIQKDNMSKMIKEDQKRREHDEQIFREQQSLEKQKWEAYYSESQKMYRDFESTTSRSKIK